MCQYGSKGTVQKGINIHSETKANKNKSKKQFFFFLTRINCTCDKIILHHCFCTYICVTKDEMKDEMKDETKQTRVIP